MARIRFKNVAFVKGALNLSDCPEPGLSEICFMGSSNVGKSSLLNAVWEGRMLARTSKRPGKTSEINFFLVDDAFMCVDLPGYGYAAVGQQKKNLWHRHVTRYIEERTALKHIFLLVDSRHPGKKGDLLALEWLFSLGKSFSIIQTKVDKVSQAVLVKNENFWLHTVSHRTSCHNVSVKNSGSIEGLRKFMLTHADIKRY